MLEHLSGIVGAALQVSGGPATNCDRPSEACLAHHARIVDALAAGDAQGAEAAMRQLLTVHPEVERVVPAPANTDPRTVVGSEGAHAPRAAGSGRRPGSPAGRPRAASGSRWRECMLLSWYEYFVVHEV